MRKRERDRERERECVCVWVGGWVGVGERERESERERVDLSVCPEYDGKECHEHHEVSSREGDTLDEDLDVRVEEAEVGEYLEPCEERVEAFAREKEVETGRVGVRVSVSVIRDSSGQRYER